MHVHVHISPHVIRTEELYVPACAEEADTKPTDPSDDCEFAHTDPFNPLGTDDTAILPITNETTVAAEPQQGDPPAVSQDPPRDDACVSANAMDLSMRTISGMSGDLGESNDSRNVVPQPSSDDSFDAASNSQSLLPPPLPVTEVHPMEPSQVTQSSKATEPRPTSEDATNEHSESRDSTTTGKSADTPDSTKDMQSQSSSGEGPLPPLSEQHQSKLVRLLHAVELIACTFLKLVASSTFALLTLQCFLLKGPPVNQTQPNGLPSLLPLPLSQAPLPWTPLVGTGTMSPSCPALALPA